MSAWGWLWFGVVTAIAAIAAIVLLVFLLGQVIGMMPHRKPPPDAGPGADVQADRTIILTQLTVGALLIILGGLGALVFGVAFKDDEKISLAIGTAVIGAGATLIPGGAAASASARIKDAEEKAERAQKKEPEKKEPGDQPGARNT